MYQPYSSTGQLAEPPQPAAPSAFFKPQRFV
jgi:hypothetical protein